MYKTDCTRGKKKVKSAQNSTSDDQKYETSRGGKLYEIKIQGKNLFL